MQYTVIRNLDDTQVYLESCVREINTDCLGRKESINEKVRALSYQGYRALDLLGKVGWSSVQVVGRDTHK